MNAQPSRLDFVSHADCAAPALLLAVGGTPARTAGQWIVTTNCWT